VVGYLTTTVLLIVHSMCQWKNFENQLIFGEDMKNDKVVRFLGHDVYRFLLYCISVNINATKKCRYQS